MRAVIALCVLLSLSTAPAAEPAVYVIVNAKNPAAKVERRFIADLFLKKRTRWSDDRTAQPVDLGPKSDTRARFSRAVLGRDIAAARRYWAQLVFSGRGVPPPELASDADVVKYVAEHAGAVGYVSSGATLAGVKVLEVE